MSFNASDPSGAGGLGRRRRDDRRDGRARAAGGHQHRHARHRRDLRPSRHRRRRDRRAGAQRPRRRDGAAWKVGFLGSPRASAPSPRSCPTIPTCRWSPTCPTCRGSRKTSSRPTSTRSANWCCRRPRCWSAATRRCADFLLPDWTASGRRRRATSPMAAGEHGARYVLVTGMPLPDQFIDNVLASPQGAHHRREVRALRGHLRRRRRHALGRAGRAAGHRRRAARRRRRGAGLPRPRLDAGFRPGMGNVVPDRFFWACPAKARKTASRRRRATAGRSRRRHRAQESAPRPLSAAAPSPSMTQRRAVRARPARHPRRRELAGARLPRRRRHAALHRRAREGAVHLGRRGQALHRLHRLLGADDPRPRPPGGARGGARRPSTTASRSARRPSARSSWPRRSSRHVP